MQRNQKSLETQTTYCLCPQVGLELKFDTLIKGSGEIFYTPTCKFGNFCASRLYSPVHAVYKFPGMVSGGNFPWGYPLIL